MNKSGLVSLETEVESKFYSASSISFYKFGDLTETEIPYPISQYAHL